MTEHDKYAKGATKPGGFAEKGYFAKSDIAKCSEQDASMQNADEVIGEQFLSAFAPWKCSICSVTCTSRETLLGHAQGAKHKRRSKAALGVTVENGKEDSVHLQTQQNLNQSKTNKENSNVANDNGKNPEAKQTTDKGRGSKDKKAGEVKWKSLALDQLKRSNGEMKVKKLVAAIKAASNDGDAEKDYILKKLKKSKKLEFDGKMVRLKFLG